MLCYFITQKILIKKTKERILIDGLFCNVKSMGIQKCLGYLLSLETICVIVTKPHRKEDHGESCFKNERKFDTDY